MRRSRSSSSEPMRTRQTIICALACLALGGCGQEPFPDRMSGSGQSDSLAMRQRMAYPEAATGDLLSLLDFEDVPGHHRGIEQAKMLSIEPSTGEGSLRFAVNITRTGAGAMGVSLPKGYRLSITMAGGRDFSRFTLLSVSIYSEAVRDDLRVTLSSEGSSWTSPRKLVLAGWNTIEIDIRRLSALPDFDVDKIQNVGLFFSDSAGSVEFYLDDLILVDNARSISPVPKGVSLRRLGLDYEISMPGCPQPVTLAQGDEGLWRLSHRLPTIQLAAPGESLPVQGDHLELMGDRPMGRVELLEHNSVRLRLANTWYFPTRAGQWVSLAVRQIRWEYTIYGDGRQVSAVELNNSGGSEIGSLRLWLTDEAGWSPGVLSRDLVIRDFQGPVAKWTYLEPPKGLRGKTLCRNHMRPGRVRSIVGSLVPYGEGDGNGDGYNESQGCYFVRSANGQCRFVLIPPPEGLLDPVINVAGPWNARVSVNIQGMALRNSPELADKSVLLVVPGWVRRPVVVEVSSRPEIRFGS